MELLGSSPIPRSFVASCVRLQLRPLPSTGVIRLLRYYWPLRHPKRPGLTLTSFPLTAAAITAGASRVASGLLCLHAVAITPAGSMESVRSSFSTVSGLPCVTVRSAPAIILSGPAQRSLALRPACSRGRQSDPLHRRLRRFRYLHRRSDCYRLERLSCRAGFAPAGDRRLFTAHSESWR